MNISKKEVFLRIFIVLTIITYSSILVIATTIENPYPTITIRYDNQVELKKIIFEKIDSTTIYTYNITPKINEIAEEFKVKILSPPLDTGDYKLTITAKELIRNNTGVYPYNFKVEIPQTEINLTEPKGIKTTAYEEIKYVGISQTRKTNITIKTNKDVTCSYDPSSLAQSPEAQYVKFDTTGQKTHKIQDFEIDKEIELPNTGVTTHKLKVLCKTINDEITRETFGLFYLIQDYSINPQFQPTKITDSSNKKFTLTIPSNQALLCKYKLKEDNSYSYFNNTIKSHSITYEHYEKNPEHYFDLTNENVFGNSNSGKLNYSIQCENLAGVKKTKDAIIEFKFERPIGITVHSPERYESSKSFDINITTNIQASSCEYSIKGMSETKELNSNNAYNFLEKGVNLNEGTHEISITCKPQDQDYHKESTISRTLTIDLENPTLTIKSQEYSCGLNSINFRLEGEDNEKIKGYNYTIEHLGTEIINWTYTTRKDVSLPLILKEPDSYTIKAKAIDESGRESNIIKKSIKASTTKEISCDLSPPSVRHNITKYNGRSEITIHCNDNNQSGCNPSYEFIIVDYEEYCNWTGIKTNYFSTPVIVHEDSRVCYRVKDLAGNNKTGFADVKVTRSTGCTVYPNSCAAGSYCDETTLTCKSINIAPEPDCKEDSDCEEYYLCTGGNCVFDVEAEIPCEEHSECSVYGNMYCVEYECLFANVDSNNDGIPDWWYYEYFGCVECSNISKTGPDDDFDGDGITNREEYEAGTDPTDKNDPPREKQELKIGGLILILIGILITGAGAWLLLYKPLEQQTQQTQNSLEKKQASTLKQNPKHELKQSTKVALQRRALKKKNRRSLFSSFANSMTDDEVEKELLSEFEKSESKQEKIIEEKKEKEQIEEKEEKNIEQEKHAEPDEKIEIKDLSKKGLFKELENKNKEEIRKILSKLLEHKKLTNFEAGELIIELYSKGKLEKTESRELMRNLKLI